MPQRNRTYYDIILLGVCSNPLEFPLPPHVCACLPVGVSLTLMVCFEPVLQAEVPEAAVALNRNELNHQNGQQMQ